MEAQKPLQLGDADTEEAQQSQKMLEPSASYATDFCLFFSFFVEEYFEKIKADGT